MEDCNVAAHIMW